MHKAGRRTVGQQPFGPDRATQGIHRALCYPRPPPCHPVTAMLDSHHHTRYGGFPGEEVARRSGRDER